ncbi:MAG: hypothetical protein ABIK09_18650 [Pseudomonadota bacterium]
MKQGRRLLLGVVGAVLFLGVAPAASAQVEDNDARLLGTFDLSYVDGQPVVSGTLYAVDGDSAVDWFRVEAGSESLLTTLAPLEMIIRVEAGGDAPHRICHRRTGGADRGRLTCADGSQLSTRWDPSAGPAGSIQVFLPTRGGILPSPESIAVILLAGSAAPLFELLIPYAHVVTTVAATDL